MADALERDCREHKVQRQDGKYSDRIPRYVGKNDQLINKLMFSRTLVNFCLNNLATYIANIIYSQNVLL
jgi:Mg2+/Co2+ transporter CorB